jgi:hypothetical protein
MSRQDEAIARVLQNALRSGRGRLPMPWLIVGLVLLGGYLFAEPWLEAKWGIDLPGLNQPGVAARNAPRNPTTQRQAPGRTEVGRPISVDALIRSDRETYTSPAGLRYSRGTQHGHHLRHLMAHASDEPDRPGQHGVFDSNDVLEVVALVDEAYQQALTGRGTRTRQEGDRTVHVIDLGHRIGYIGGQSGNRRSRPAARHLQLVLVGKKMITAYPIVP